jgi:hypothetical protein
MIDFTIFYKESLPTQGQWTNKRWDLLISAFNSSDRVAHCFKQAAAEEKHWLVMPEYGYSSAEHPLGGRVFAPNERNEADFVLAYESSAAMKFDGLRMAVDITGFMRPHLLFLLRLLKERGVKKFDALYSEPMRYQAKDETRFSKGCVSEVRQVAGFEGQHASDTTNDYLIIGAGYDHELIAHVATAKENTQVIQLYGLPSLRADMYQESVLRAAKAAEATSGREGARHKYFATANDPFINADMIDNIIRDVSAKSVITNLYLSPLATKAQALGFGLFYLWRDPTTVPPISIIFPFSPEYERETSVGIARIWNYTIELP